MAKELAMNTEAHSVKAWIQVFRPFSYTASIIPTILGAVIAVYQDLSVQRLLLPLVVIASVLIQAGTNLVSEYYDLKRGVDRPETYGSSRVLVEKLLNPRDVFFVGICCFAASICIGFVFIAIHGWPILLLGLIGILGGVFYTAGPIGYKYVGLGDLFVFILTGPLMVIGSFFVLTGTYNHSVLLISLPIGFLVTAILSGNNLRDIYHDTQANIKTTATILGPRWAKWEYTGLVICAYIVIAGMLILKILPFWSLLIVLTLPLAVKNIKAALNSSIDKPEQIATLDVQTAQLHMLFGLLLILSLILGGLL